MIKVIDNEALDVRAIVVLVSHDHQVTITQAVRGSVVRVVLQAENLLDVLNFHILYDLVVTGFPDVEKLASKWEHAVLVSAHHRQTRHRERFG